MSSAGERTPSRSVSPVAASSVSRRSTPPSSRSISPSPPAQHHSDSLVEQRSAAVAAQPTILKPTSLEDTVMYLNARGEALGAAGNLVDADESLRAAHKRIVDADESVLSNERQRDLLILTLNNLGVLYRRKHNEAQALQYLESVQRLEEETPEGVSAHTLVNLASTFGALQRINESIAAADSARIALFRKFPTVAALNEKATAHDCLLFSAVWFHLARGLLLKLEKDGDHSPRSALQVLQFYRKALHTSRALSGRARSTEVEFMLEEYAAARDKLKGFIGVRLPRAEALPDPPGFPSDADCAHPTLDPAKPLSTWAAALFPPTAKRLDEPPRHSDDASESAADADAATAAKRSHDLTRKLNETRVKRKEERRKKKKRQGGHIVSEAYRIYGASNLRAVIKHSPKKVRDVSSSSAAAGHKPTAPATETTGGTLSNDGREKQSDRSDASSRSSRAPTPSEPARSESLPPIALPRATGPHQRIVPKAPPKQTVAPPPAPRAAHHHQSQLPAIDAHRSSRGTRHQQPPPQQPQPAPHGLSEGARQQQLDRRLPPILFVFPHLHALQILLDAAEKSEKNVPGLAMIYLRHREDDTLFPRFLLKSHVASRSFFAAPPSDGAPGGRRQRAPMAFLEPTQSSSTRAADRRRSRIQSSASSVDESRREELLHKRVHSRVRRMRVLNQTADVLEAKNVAIVMRVYYRRWSQVLRTRRLAKPLAKAVALLQRTNERILISNFFRPWARFGLATRMERDAAERKEQEERLRREREELDAERLRLEGERGGPGVVAAAAVAGGAAARGRGGTTAATAHNASKKQPSMRKSASTVKPAAPSQHAPSAPPLPSPPPPPVQIEDVLFDQVTNVTNAWLAIDAAPRTDDEKRDLIESLNRQKEEFVATLTKFLDSADGQQQLRLFGGKNPDDEILERERRITAKLAALFTLGVEEQSLHSAQNEAMILFMLKRLSPFCNFSEITEEHNLIASCIDEVSETYLDLLLGNGVTVPVRSEALVAALNSIIALSDAADRAKMVAKLLQHSAALPLAKQKRQLAPLWIEIAGDLIPQERGYAMLGESASVARIDVLRTMCATDGVGINLAFEFPDGQTLLTRACGNGDHQTFTVLHEYLYASTATLSIDARNDLLVKPLKGSGTTPLMEAVVGGCVAIVAELLKATCVRESINQPLTLIDALVGLSDQHTWTPLSFALNELELYTTAAAISNKDATERMREIVRLLVESGAKGDAARIRAVLGGGEGGTVAVGDDDEGDTAREGRSSAAGRVQSPGQESWNMTFNLSTHGLNTPTDEIEPSPRSDEAQAPAAANVSGAAERERAVIKIQALQRQRAARAEFERRRAAARAPKMKDESAALEPPAASNDAEGDRRRAAAALKMQSAFRQRAAKEAVANRRAEAARRRQQQRQQQLPVSQPAATKGTPDSQAKAVLRLQSLKRQSDAKVVVAAKRRERDEQKAATADPAAPAEGQLHSTNNNDAKQAATLKLQCAFRQRAAAAEVDKRRKAKRRERDEQKVATADPAAPAEGQLHSTNNKDAKQAATLKLQCASRQRAAAVEVDKRRKAKQRAPDGTEDRKLRAVQTLQNASRQRDAAKAVETKRARKKAAATAATQVAVAHPPVAPKPSPASTSGAVNPRASWFSKRTPVTTTTGTRTAANDDELFLDAVKASASIVAETPPTYGDNGEVPSTPRSVGAASSTGSGAGRHLTMMFSGLEVDDSEVTAKYPAMAMLLRVLPPDHSSINSNI